MFATDIGKHIGNDWHILTPVDTLPIISKVAPVKLGILDHVHLPVPLLINHSLLKFASAYGCLPMTLALK
jgi:hypothetical protein